MAEIRQQSGLISARLRRLYGLDVAGWPAARAAESIDDRDPRTYTGIDLGADGRGDMGRLNISGPVRHAMGRNADMLDAGRGLPDEAQCWQCGQGIDIAGARPGAVSLSAIVVGSISVTAFGHAQHAPSRVFTGDEFEAAAQASGVAQMPSPVQSVGATMYVEGQEMGTVDDMP